MSWSGIDDDDKLIVAWEMKQAIDAFMGLGVAAVERACNDRRTWLCANGGAEMAQRLIGGGALQTALDELAPAFTLAAPGQLVVEFIAGHHANPQCPMMCYFAAPPVRITVDVTALDVPQRRVRHFAMSIRDCTLHELVHAHGDVQNDGIYRHNVAAVEAIDRVLRGLPAAG